jgi:hypothetical protein
VIVSEVPVEVESCNQICPNCGASDGWPAYVTLNEMRMRIIATASTLLVLVGCAATTRVFDSQTVRTVTNSGPVQVHPIPRPGEPSDLGRANPPVVKAKMPPSNPSPTQNPMTTVPPIDPQQLPQDRCSGGSANGKQPLPECMPA